MADVTVVLEPVPTGAFADFTITVDPFVVAREYEILDTSAPATPSPSFSLVAFDPLNQGLIAATDTVLTLDMHLTSGVLDPNDVAIQIDGSTIYQSGTFFGEYTGSSITPQGGGVFRFELVKATSWTVGSAHEVRVFPPGETP